MSTLNASQQEAILHNEGPALVFAGAGSGKTTVVTKRILRLLLEKRAEPGEICAVTFTNKAAKEMIQRLSKDLPAEVVKQIQVGTFHSLGAKILRKFANEVGRTRDFSILEPRQQNKIVTKLLETSKYPGSTCEGTLEMISKWKQDGHHIKRDVPYNPPPSFHRSPN